MTTTYTPEELSKLTAAVMLSGMAVSIVDVGIISTAIEAGTLAQEVAGAAKKYPTNTIIQSLFSDDAIKELKAHGGIKVDVKPDEVKPETAVDTAIAKINSALTVLAGKATPEEISEYKSFIYTCAEHVAQAAGSGLFGSGNPKISPTEAAALAKLKTALAI
jgi:hypothetical protein